MRTRIPFPSNREKCPHATRLAPLAAPQWGLSVLGRPGGKKIGRMTHAMLAALSAALLAGCSGEPSDSDVTAAFERYVESANAAASSIAGKLPPDMRTELKSTRKLGCADAGGGAYLCDVEVDMKTALGQMKRTSKFRFIKGSDGWAVSM